MSGGGVQLFPPMAETFKKSRGVWSALVVDTIMEVMGKAGNITSDNLKLSEVTVCTTLENTRVYRCM